ncbi:MAG: RNA polymerase sigma factor [Planctomycetota bacterium]
MTREASDEALLAGYLSGDDAMFSELVHRYERPLHGFICRLTGQPGVAADLFQETFVRVVEKGQTFEGRSRFKTWLYAIAANLCRSHLRRKGRETPTPDPPERPDEGLGPNGAARDREVGERIAAAVAALPVAQREVFILKTYDELTYAQIAQALGRPVGTVKTQMRAALGKLRRDLRSIAEAYGVT